MQPCYAGVLPYPEESADTVTMVFPEFEYEPEPDPAVEDSAEDATIVFPQFEYEPEPEPPIEDAAEDATVVLPRINHEPVPEPPINDPAEDATIVLPRIEHDPDPDPAPDPSVKTALASDTGSTLTGKKVAVGAVVAGGLVAGQIGWTAAFADQADSAEFSSMLAASSTSSSMLPVPSQPDAGLNRQDIDQLHRGDELAMEAAFAHAASAHGMPVNTAPTRAAAQLEALVLHGGGNLDDWISVALQKLRLAQAWAPAVKRIVLEESRGNPGAINRWDSNAMAGRASQGLMQLIPSTYRRYVLPEFAGRPITDPVANITAGIRYMLANYGYLTLSRGGRYNALGEYLGY
jgi:hypothetical protein